MTYDQFCLALGGERHPDFDKRQRIFSIALWTPEQIREKAGMEGEIDIYPTGGIFLRFKLEDEIALVVGMLKPDGYLHDARLNPV